MSSNSFQTITSRLGEYCDLVNQEMMNPNKIPVGKILKAINSDPVASACVSLVTSRAMQLMNTKYKNEKNEEIEKFVTTAFEKMNDNLSTLAGEMSSAVIVGNAVAEIIFKRGNKLSLQGFHILNPARVSYKASRGRVTEVKYNDSGKTKHVPMWKCLHVTNGVSTAFGIDKVYGIQGGHKAYSLIRLKQLIMSNMAVTSRRLATGLLVGQTDSSHDTVLLDPKTGKAKLDPKTGKPMKVKASYNLFQQFKAVENFGFMVLDKNDIVTSLNVNGGEQFWNLAITIIDQQLMRCFQIPDTAFQAPTNPFGNGLVSNNQLSLLDSSIMGFVVRLKEGLLEKVIKPLIYLNFGKHNSLGNWEIYDEVNEQRNQQALSNILQAIGTGAISNQDYGALNVLREKLGLPEVNVETVAQQKEMEAQIQNLQQKVSMLGQAQTQKEISEKMQEDQPEQEDENPEEYLEENVN